MDIVNTIRTTKVQPINRNATFQHQAKNTKKVDIVQSGKILDSKQSINNNVKTIDVKSSKKIDTEPQIISTKTEKKSIKSPSITITLPLSPITRVINNKKEVIVESNIIVQQNAMEVKGSILDIVNFIDVEKIMDVKKSKNTSVYELKQMKSFAKAIEINFNNITKAILIGDIKRKIDDYLHGENNLVYDIKHMSKKLNAEKTYDQIDIMFDKHHISDNKKATLLPQIKNQLKESDVNKLDHIIHILEKEWL
jgi:hypothetical protein